jgi:hypothetical protein
MVWGCLVSSTRLILVSDWFIKCVIGRLEFKDHFNSFSLRCHHGAISHHVEDITSWFQIFGNKILWKFKISVLWISHLCNLCHLIYEMEFRLVGCWFSQVCGQSLDINHWILFRMPGVSTSMSQVHSEGIYWIFSLCWAPCLQGGDKKDSPKGSRYSACHLGASSLAKQMRLAHK